MTPRHERIVVTVALTVPVVLAAVSALTLGPAARRMPLAVALPTLALLLIELVRARRSDAGFEPRPLEPALFGWLAALALATVVTGVLVGPAMLLATYLRFQSRERWPIVIGVAAAFAAVVFVVFDLVLDLPAGGVIGMWPR